MEMRRRNYSYREISRVLTERCGFQINHSTIHDFENGIARNRAH